MQKTKYVQNYITTKYPLAKHIKTLTKDSFTEFVYKESALAFIVLRTLGSSWAKNQEEVEQNIYELIDHALGDIRKGKKATYCASGMLRVELTVTKEWEDSGEEVIYPQLLLEF